MKKDEESQFLISYKLLFGEMGCPPRIPEKSDGLFIIHLVDWANIGNQNALENMTTTEKKSFTAILESANEIRISGVDHFKRGRTTAAVKAFHKAVSALENAPLKNEDEQKIQRENIISLYLNLAVCYNSLNLPKKTCSMCNEIGRISNIKKNCKALFQQGRAYLYLGEYERALQNLNLAKSLEPNNLSIAKELKLLEVKYKKHKEDELDLCQRAFNMKTSSDKTDKLQTTKPESVKLLHSDCELKDVLENFHQNEKIKKITLPNGMTQDEISWIKEASAELNMRFESMDVNDCTEMYLVKK